MKIIAINVALSEYEYTQLLKKYEHDIGVRGFLHRAFDSAVNEEARIIDLSGRWDSSEEDEGESA